VPVDQLLPDDGSEQRSRSAIEKGDKVAIDLGRLARPGQLVPRAAMHLAPAPRPGR